MSIIADDPMIIPLYTEHLCIGIDVGKQNHIAAFVSISLLKTNKRFERCPTLPFTNSRSGFEQLVTAMRFHGPPACCAVLVEHTGHYHRALVEYLQERNIATYVIQVSKQSKKIKTDKRDALALANTLYNQLALGIQVADPTQEVRRLLPASPAAALLAHLVRHRYELSREETRRKNKLTAICDELFPELTQVFKDPNGPTALDIRATFPTPAAVRQASLAELLAYRRATFPGNAAFARLRELAVQSIGCKEEGRCLGLVIEQGQLITELRLIQTNLSALDAEFARLVPLSREGQILLSLPGVGIVHAAEIIAAIGCIANFENSGKLRGYFGWSPTQRQTGSTMDRMDQTHGGQRPVKAAMYLVAWNAIQGDTEWRALYERLVPRLCQWDERKQSWTGKSKVLGRIIGQVINLIYVLLRRDYDLLEGLEAGQDPPPPEIYDRAIHRAHRTGHR